jgi:hypothetical protein
VATRRERKAGEAQLLDPAKGVLDEIPAAVALLVVAYSAPLVVPSGDDRAGALVPQGLAQAVGILPFVARSIAHAACALEQWRRSLHAADIASGQHHGI